MTVLSLLPPPLADIALTHSLHHDQFIECMAISVIESIKLILRGVAFKMGVVLELGVVRLRGGKKKSPPFSNPRSAPVVESCKVSSLCPSTKLIESQH